MRTRSRSPLWHESPPHLAHLGRESTEPGLTQQGWGPSSPLLHSRASPVLQNSRESQEIPEEDAHGCSSLGSQIFEPLKGLP